MSEGWAAWLAERHVQETPAQKLARQAAQGAERQERAELADEAERAAELEDERDARALRFQQAGLTGHSLGDVFTEASRAADEDAAYCEALKTIDKIDRRRARRAEAQRFEAEQLASVAQRSADPFEAAQAEAHRAFAAHTRRMVAEAQAGTLAPPPFVFRGGAGDGEPDCPECRAAGASVSESFLLHSDPWKLDPDAPPAAPDNEAASDQTVRAGRRGREITRLTSADGMGQPSTLTGMVVR
jgi:hypothetical protein